MGLIEMSGAMVVSISSHDHLVGFVYSLAFQNCAPVLGNYSK